MTDDRKDTSSLVSVSQTDLITWLGRDGIVGSTLDLRGNDLTGRRSEMGVHGVNIRRRFDPWSTDIEGALRHQEIYRSMNSLCLSVVWTLHWDGTNYHIYKTHLPASYLVHDREALTIKMRSGTPILAGHRKEPGTGSEKGGVPARAWKRRGIYRANDRRNGQDGRRKHLVGKRRMRGYLPECDVYGHNTREHYTSGRAGYRQHHRRADAV